MTKPSSNTGCTICKSPDGNKSLLEQLQEKTIASDKPQTLVIDHSPICETCNAKITELGATIRVTTPSSANFMFRIIDS